MILNICSPNSKSYCHSQKKLSIMENNPWNVKHSEQIDGSYKKSATSRWKRHHFVRTCLSFQKSKQDSENESLFSNTIPHEKEHIWQVSKYNM